jgi:hypothetical protein
MGKNSKRPVVVAHCQIYNVAAESINAAMDDKASANELIITIYVPQ